MKVCISVCGRFHAYYLAEQLQQRGYLKLLITSLPKFIVRKYGIQSDRIISIISKEVLQRGWAKLPGSIRSQINPDYSLLRLYDFLASKHIPDCDIFVGWSGCSLQSMSVAKQRGAIVVLERGSAHIEVQKAILDEEIKRYGISHNTPMDQRIVDRELAEYEQADFIETISTFAYNSFIDKGFPPDRLLMTPLGVDTHLFATPINKKWNGVFQIIYAGQMSLQKGVHYLLQAVDSMGSSNFELTLIGSMLPEMEPYFKRYHGKFRYIPSVPQAKLNSHYAQAHVFVLNSIHDGFGMVIAQAMGAGLPVIATSHSGGPDIIRDGVDGFIIPPRDAQALREKLLLLAKDRVLCQRMGASARQRISSGFTWDDYGVRIKAMYENCLQLTKTINYRSGADY